MKIKLAHIILIVLLLVVIWMLWKIATAQKVSLWPPFSEKLATNPYVGTFYEQIRI